MKTRWIIAEEEGFALKFFVKAMILVVVVLFALSEVGPLIWFRFTTIQDAEDLAASIATEYRINKDTQGIVDLMAYKLRMMDYKEDEISQCVIELLPANSDEKTSVRITVVKYANTLVTRHIKQLKKYSRVATTREAAIPTRMPGTGESE
ncbi:MAG: hypothetical protein JXA49_03190 [Actinobacteria bacterium]|nr:hypothetical protein [Actinomycetota bacterium]